MASPLTHRYDGRVTTRDTVFGGRLVLEQPAGSAYRVNHDSLILAAFAVGERPVARAFDLGAGVGPVGHALLFWNATERVTFLDIEPAVLSLALRNGDHNGWRDRIDALAGDVLDSALTQQGVSDLVVCNPPYTEPDTGRPPGNESLARSRTGDIERFVQAARQVAGKSSRVCFIYPAASLTTLLVACRGQGLEPKRLRFVHAREGDPARVVLLELKPARPGGLMVLAPLVEWTTRDQRCEELSRLLDRGER